MILTTKVENDPGFRFRNLITLFSIFLSEGLYSSQEQSRPGEKLRASFLLRRISETRSALRELKKTIKGAHRSGCSVGFFNTCLLSLLILWKVSQLWRSSSIVPVPKIGVPSTPREYRPVALTSHILKTCRSASRTPVS